MNRGFAGVCLLVGLAVLGTVAFAAVAGTAGATETAPEDEDNASLGTDISSFMQASSAEAAGEVEDGRFEAAMNRTDNATEREALIEARQARLEARNTRLSEQREAFGNSPDVRNRSIATRIAVEATGIERAANSTERRAVEIGANTERIAKIRSDARTIRGSGVAELARGVAGPPSSIPAVGDGPRQPDPGQPADNGTVSDARDAQRGPPADAGGSNQTGPPDSEDRPGTADDTSGDGEASDAADNPGERDDSESGDRNSDTANDNSAPNDDAGPPDHAGGPP